MYYICVNEVWIVESKSMLFEAATAKVNSKYMKWYVKKYGKSGLAKKIAITYIRITKLNIPIPTYTRQHANRTVANPPFVLLYFVGFELNV